MANPSELRPSADISDKGANGQAPAKKPAETTQALEKTIAELREENAMLRHNLLHCLFPPETTPPFDPADYKPTTWEELLADLKTVEHE